MIYPPIELLENKFDLPGSITDISPLGSGHIHDTYLLTCEGSGRPRFVLQRFNRKVFQQPVQVMNNINLVLEHIRAVNQATDFQQLHIIKTRDNRLIYPDNEGNFFRLYNYIGQSESFDLITQPELAFGGARAFGQFIDLLNDLDPGTLYTTIPDFHNLQVRFEQLQIAVKEDRADRVNSHQAEIDFVLCREAQVINCSKLMNHHEIPRRVTHNDTKINNVLFEIGSTKGICVVDLDTVMPGLLLYDFGDMGRTFCNAVSEEAPAQEVAFRLDIFEAVCEGFFSGIQTTISQAEIDSLKIGPWWLTFIMGIRFLTDFLAGDTYYKVDRPMQNLERARNQLGLTKDIEKKQPEINSILEQYDKPSYS